MISYFKYTIVFYTIEQKNKHIGEKKLKTEKTEKLRTIAEFCTSRHWINNVSEVKFLAAGEYNENYTVTDTMDKHFVFRINHGSQLNLSDQISYEFKVLRALENSGVTPRPLYVEENTKSFEGGVLLMEFLDGLPLNYQNDAPVAAKIFSRIHQQPVDRSLVVQADPVRDIARESYGLITRFPDHPMSREKKQLLELHEKIQLLGESTSKDFISEDMCIVNTEVNSHNFLIREKEGSLVDWEKAVISSRYQDLGHFLTPTTTLWKTDYLYSKKEKTAFLDIYRTAGGITIGLEELQRKTSILEKTIILRGLSWCFMAWYEYSRTDRTLENNFTFKKIESYLKNINWFINDSLNQG